MNSKRKRRGKQLPLPFDETQRRAHTREPKEFYGLVTALRALGYPVYRISGDTCRFNGRIVSNAGLRRIGRKLLEDENAA